MKLKIPAILRITNPLWVKKFEKRRTWGAINRRCTIDGQKLDIGEYALCFVGETLNLFDESYEMAHDIVSFHRGCQICADFSNEFNHIIDTLTLNILYSKHHLEIELERFAEHIQENHPDYIVNARARRKRE